jgi:colanic acid/amylovoran biosynthesis glycosyltransferase
MKRLAYVLATFPTLTETFVVGEILELRRRGLTIDLFALRPSAAPVPSPEAEGLRSETTYARPLGDRRLLAANVRRALRQPLRYFGTLAMLVRGTWRNPVHCAKTVALFATAADLAGEMERRGVEHLHAHWATYPTTLALAVGALIGRRYSFTAHAWDVSLIRTFLPEKVRRATFVVTCTAENRQALAALVPAGERAKVRLNYHGISLDRFPPATRPAAPARPHIVSCGSLFERKGFADLVRACALLQARGVAFHCTLIGDGPQRPILERLVEASGLREHVTLTGALAPTEVARACAGADVFALPCLARSVGAGDAEADALKALEAWFEGPRSEIKDGIPNVLVEAMATGAAVVASAIAGIPELIEDDVTGVLVPQKDPVALADALAALLADPARRRRLGERAAADVRARFDRRVNVTALTDIFATYLDGPTAAVTSVTALAEATP